MSKEITDQAGFIAASGFWETPIGKQWIKEEAERAKNRPPPKIEMVMLNMKDCKIERFEDD